MDKDRRNFYIASIIYGLFSLIIAVLFDPWIGIIGVVLNGVLFVRTCFDFAKYEPVMIDITDLYDGRRDISFADEIVNMSRIIFNDMYDDPMKFLEYRKHFCGFFVSSIDSNPTSKSIPVTFLVLYNKERIMKDNDIKVITSSFFRPKEILKLPKKRIINKKLIRNEVCKISYGSVGKEFETHFWENKETGIIYRLAYNTLFMNDLHFVDGYEKMIENFTDYIRTDEFSERFNSAWNRHDRPE